MAAPLQGQTVPDALVQIDGSDGGGQVLRNSFVLSALTGRPTRVANIRGARNPPGLKAQHLTGIRACGEANTGAVLEGAELASETVHYSPGGFIRGGAVLADAQTAGSCTLLLQTLVPLMLFARADPGYSRVTVRGGTDVAFSPPLDFFTHVLTPTLAKFGAAVNVVGARRGVFPKGQGEVVVDVDQLTSPLRAVTLTDPGHLTKLTAHIFMMQQLPGAQTKLQSAVTGATAALEGIKAVCTGRGITHPGGVVTVDVKAEVASGVGAGGGVVYVAETSTGQRFSASALVDGKGRVPFEKELARAAGELQATLVSRVAVDAELQDQLVLFAALAAGETRYLTGAITDHTRSAIEVVAAFTAAEFRIEPVGDGMNVVACKGIAHPPVAALSSAAVPAAERPPARVAAAAQPQRRPASGRGGMAPRAPERRRDTDGRWYTREEFAAYYGGDAEWNRARGRQ